MNQAIFIIETERPAIVMTRIFDAPLKLVYSVYTDSKHKANWWGCKTITNEIVDMDVRPGGLWRIVQHDADGKRIATHGKYLEVIPHEKIVNTFESEDMPGHIITETTTFEEQGNKTKLTITSLFMSLDDREGMIGAGMESGATESMNQLEELLLKSK